MQTLSDVIKYLSEKAKEEQEKQQQDALRKVIAVHKDLIDHTFGQAKAYTELILGAGYVGLFTVWSFTKQRLSPTQELLAAVLVLSSLIVFVVFQVLQMVSMTNMLQQWAETIKKTDDLSLRMDELLEKQRQARAALMPWWRRVVIFTAFSGIGGGIVLLYAFIERLRVG